MVQVWNSLFFGTNLLKLPSSYKSGDYPRAHSTSFPSMRCGGDSATPQAGDEPTSTTTGTCLAYSADGLHFDKPMLDVRNGTNMVHPVRSPAWLSTGFISPDSTIVLADVTGCIRRKHRVAGPFRTKRKSPIQNGFCGCFERLRCTGVRAVFAVFLILTICVCAGVYTSRKCRRHSLGGGDQPNSWPHPRLLSSIQQPIPKQMGVLSQDGDCVWRRARPSLLGVHFALQ